VADVYLRSRKELVAWRAIAHSDDAVRDWMKSRLIPAGETTVAVVAGAIVGSWRFREIATAAGSSSSIWRPPGRTARRQLLEIARSALPRRFGLHFQGNERLAASIAPRLHGDQVQRRREQRGEVSGRLYEWRP